MTPTELLRLTRIEVDGLFDVYNHRIELNLDKRVTLLHGPNGVGKTVILRMTDAFLQNQLEYFQTIPFSRFLLGFHDGSNLTLEATKRANNRDTTYVLKLLKGKKTIESSIIDWNQRAEFVATQIDYLRPHDKSSNTWIDIRDREILSSADVVVRYGRPSPELEDSDVRDDMTWFDEFQNKANTHLIEAHRLVRTDWESNYWHEYPWHTRPRSKDATVVVEYSNDFRNRLAHTMEQYGRRSQTLDQSFPQRLISAIDLLHVSEIQEQLTILGERTARLKDLGILDKTQAHPFDVDSFDDIDSTQVRVMTLYVSDTAEKLEVLDDLAKQTGLLLDNVNQKFRNKAIRLDREHGFVAVSENNKQLPLDSLSSGEQHELVLNYDLLFKVPSNTIVLIDEPELSLHVAWQKRFLPDLLEIIQLSDFDALVATHSPFVIGEMDNLMVGLGGND